MKDNFRYLKNSLTCFPWKILSKINIYKDISPPIKYVAEEANWAIKNVGENMKRELDIINPQKFEITTNPSKITKKIVHFGSQYMWLNWGSHMSKDNYFISTFFHGKPSDGDEVKYHIERFLKSVPRLQKVITASTIVEKRLLNWGVPSEKIIKIPLGVNTKKFILPSKERQSKIRDLLNIPRESILIGSFQKDGIGWGEGLKPKLIKGPDIFVQTLKRLSKKGLPVYALLTGPSRGYVKEKLKQANIPFFHSYVTNSDELIPLYQALDLYLITSREEGGPLGLIESMACGVPVVSTRVGMAEDVIQDDIPGEISRTIDSKNLANKVELILNSFYKNKKESQKLIRKHIIRFDWEEIAKQHWEKVYKELI
ncbi:hypothetical protein CU313_06970 [Prochlorococcus marinus str. MU1404]|uniref:glycosyltransferase family 4 protein n=1 Tax=Prochlorococcus marinus TaxID=1219 RepID=UPI001ADB1E6C|nr:glycosyltransferase family 4 protein [Prochlorococcus marinus XMU1404]MBW3073609.1 hypothetical protein [Prochlorococcus marinus str. MU1404]MCR8545104.1 glycosyltransferase family 4 protein [Prochlorococcus marinus CUG1432]